MAESDIFKYVRGSTITIGKASNVNGNRESTLKISGTVIENFKIRGIESNKYKGEYIQGNIVYTDNYGYENVCGYFKVITTDDGKIVGVEMDYNLNSVIYRNSNSIRLDKNDGNLCELTISYNFVG